MGLFQDITDEGLWREFLSRKREQGCLSRREEKDLAEYVENREYLQEAERIRSGKAFPLPVKHLISKTGTDKKRTVYQFPRGFGYLLKLAAWRMYRYDGIFAANLWSFRKGRTVRQGIRQLLSAGVGRRLYSYKVDIHDYFNSVDVDRLLPMLEKIFGENAEETDFCRRLLLEKRVIFEGKIICEEKGIMAGMPLSSFFANVYLKEMDAWFEARGALYARYSDDIIVFAESEEELAEYRRQVEKFIQDARLTFNPDKAALTKPGEKWCFLGVSVDGREVDVAPVSVKKIKRKMKRKADALVRWKKRKGASDERAVRAFIRCFNRKFFENPVHSELTWCRWFFPLITTDESLKAIDHYMQECIRYVALGRHSKAGYNLRYETMKEYGYRPLVSAYYGSVPEEKVKCPHHKTPPFRCRNGRR